MGELLVFRTTIICGHNLSWLNEEEKTRIMLYDRKLSIKHTFEQLERSVNN